MFLKRKHRRQVWIDLKNNSNVCNVRTRETSVRLWRVAAKSSIILQRKWRRSDVASWSIHRKYNLMFTLSSDKDFRKKFAFAFVSAQCKWTLSAANILYSSMNKAARTFNRRMPINAGDGFVFAELQICKWLIFLQQRHRNNVNLSPFSGSSGHPVASRNYYLWYEFHISF